MTEPVPWFHWHKWTQWEPYTWKGTNYGLATNLTQGIPCSERRQKRHCIICLKEQDERVTSS